MIAYSINKNLLPLKVHYFLLSGACSGVIGFIPVYAQQLGISLGAIGSILAILSCLSGMSKTAFGGIADRFQNLKKLLLVLIVINVVASLGLNFIPKPYQVPVSASNNNLMCHGGSSYLISGDDRGCAPENNATEGCLPRCSLCETDSPVCRDRLNVTSFREGPNSTSGPDLECVPSNETKCTEACFDGSSECEDISGTNPPLQLWLLGMLVTLVYMATGSIVSLTDAACYQALGDRPQLFGRQRMWGTVGWGLFAFLTGYLDQLLTGSSKVSSYSAGYYTLAVLFVVDLLVIRNIQLEDLDQSRTICVDVYSLLVQPKIAVFIIGVFGIGVLAGITRAYLFWYLRTMLEASQLELGCIAAVQCFLGELPFFFFSGWIISKIGHINTFTMSFVAYGFKFLGHSFLTNPWYALLIEFLQGPCFGSFYSAMTSYSKLIAPEGATATVQGMVGGAFEGLGIATGSLLGGFCMSTFGGRKTFYWTGMLSLSAGALHYVVHLLLNSKKDCEEEEKAKNAF